MACKIFELFSSEDPVKIKSASFILFVLMLGWSTSVMAQPAKPDDCVQRLIAYDIQSHPVLSDVNVTFANGRASLSLFGSNGSRWSNATRLAIQRGERLSAIVRRDRAVSHLIALENRIRQIPLVTSISCSADKPCTPGFVCQITGGYVTAESVAPCAVYKNTASAKGRAGGLGVFKKPLDDLLPAKIGKFKLLQKAGGPYPGMEDLNLVETGGGVYISTDKKALHLSMYNFAELTGPDKAMQLIVTDNGRRPGNSVSDGPAKIKGKKVVGKYYTVNLRGADVAISFWSNGSVLFFIQGTRNTKRELGLQPASAAEIKAFENALSF